MTPWIPTHGLFLSPPPSRVQLMLVDGCGYTEEQWNNELRPEWHLVKGKWCRLRRGREVNVVAVPIAPCYVGIGPRATSSTDGYVSYVGHSVQEVRAQAPNAFILRVTPEIAAQVREGETDTSKLGIVVKRATAAGGRVVGALRPVICKRWFHSVPEGTAIEFRLFEADKFRPATITGRSPGGTRLHIRLGPLHNYALMWNDVRKQVRLP